MNDYVYENIGASDEGASGMFETNAPKEVLLKAYQYADLTYYEDDSIWEDSFHHYLNKQGYTVEEFKPSFILYDGRE